MASKRRASGRPGKRAGADLLARGRQALACGAWETARDLLQEAASRHPTPEALEWLGWAYYWLDDAERLFEIRDQAYRKHLERGDRRSAARVAMWLAYDYAEFRGERAVADGLLQRAGQLLDGLDPSPEHAWFVALTAHEVLLGQKDPARAVAVASEGIQIARATGAQEVAVLLDAQIGLAAVTQGDIDEGMRRLDNAAAAALGGEITDLPAIATVCCYVIHACERARDYERGGQWCERLKELTTRWRYGSMLGSCRMQYAGVLICRGEWEAAEAELSAGIELLARVRPALVRSALPRLAELRRRQGRWDEATELFRQVDHTPLGQLGLAELAHDRGDAATAADLAERYLRRFAADDCLERVPGLDLLARARLALDEEAAAAAIVAEFEAIAQEVAVPVVRASAHLAAGALEFARGAFDGARRRFEDAVDLFARGGCPFEEGRARLELARTLDALGRPEAARSEAQAASQALAHLGAQRLVERIGAFLSGLSFERSATVSAPVMPVTGRELEVLRLVAQGLSDKEIAGRLFISPHTVHRHISNMLLKIDQPSRAAAVAWAARHSLV
jgi:ATP/maltotriose-dependent transcriptional regulator MalT